MKRLQKKKVQVFVSLLLIVSLVMCGMPAKAENRSDPEKQTYREKAVTWLKKQAVDGNEWEDSGLINLTCDALAVLRMENEEIQSTYLEQWEKDKGEKNVDERAHLCWAQGDGSYLEELWKNQNPDGGFGLTGRYTSEGYDTLLALKAAAASGTEVSRSVREAAGYLLENQNGDGGFGVVEDAESETGFSAETGIVLCSLELGTEESLSGLDAYCQDKFQNDFGEETFYEQAKLARYLYQRGCIPDPEETEKRLYATQSEDGSVYGNVSDTIQFILLLREIEDYHRLKFQITGLVTEADTYVLECGREQQISLNTAVTYSVNQKFEGKIRYTVLEDGKEVSRDEENMCFLPKRTEEVCSAAITVKPAEEKEYILKTEIVSLDEEGQEVLWKSEETAFTIHDTEEKELTLEAEVTQGTSCGLRLKWNDISDENDRYGYRLLRQKGEGEWENRSVWDGKEKVKVLNIYPCIQAKDYLEKWMNETVSDASEPAGKGLFEIDKVFIDDFNKDPDKYLLNGEEEYNFDVLMFGTYDCNAYQDLTEKSYQAIKEYIGSGRGVLFGHDTITTNYQVNHPVFSRFAEQMGIRLIWDGAVNPCNKVKVVNSGFLTSYPWKLSGVLTIPATHCLGQYTGGGMKAAVWMEFQNSCLTDPETGAKNNAYLFTHNNLAMIQTGHSSGQATDDERKVLANTLFYLKQFTSQTEVSDKSFYDETAPEKPHVSAIEKDADGQTYITFSAEDQGTDYRYRVEAVSSRDEELERKTSNTVTTTALSGIRGYITGISDSEEPMKELTSRDETGALMSEILEAPEGDARFGLGELDAGTHYLHVYAVDNAGNISGETVREIVIQSEEEDSFDSPFALFAGGGELEINCCEANIDGSVYGRDAFRFQGSILNLAGEAVSSQNISVAGWKLNLGGREENAEICPVPDYMDLILRDMETGGQEVKHLQAYNSMEVLAPVLCQTTTGAYCPDVHLAASLVSEGTVSLNANTVRSGAVLCSRTGDITIQATKLSGSGLIYAPKGTVTIQVSEMDFEGSIIAEKIKIQAGTIDIRK